MSKNRQFQTSDNPRFIVAPYMTKLLCVTLLFVAGDAMAAALTLGGMASSMIGSLGSIAKLITAGAYIAGLAFAVGAIIKFKAHKDQPQQVPIGQPIGLLFVAAALLFLPSILNVAGQTMFGGAQSTGGQAAGTIFKGS